MILVARRFTRGHIRSNSEKVKTNYAPLAFKKKNNFPIQIIIQSKSNIRGTASDSSVQTSVLQASLDHDNGLNLVLSIKSVSKIKSKVSNIEIAGKKLFLKWDWSMLST